MIKLLACFFMLIDHIGKIFFPNIILLRIIGRLSMPFYAFCIAYGIKRTKNINNYISRLLYIALLAQVPFSLVNWICGESLTGIITLNICFTWILSILSILLVDKFIETKKNKVIIIGIMLIVIMCVLIPMDYGIYGIGFVMLFYYQFFSQKENWTKKYNYLSYAGLEILDFIKNPASGIMQLFTFPAWSFAKYYKTHDLEKKFPKIENFSKNKFVFYFYPVHLAILFGIKYVITYIL